MFVQRGCPAQITFRVDEIVFGALQKSCSLKFFLPPASAKMQRGVCGLMMYESIEEEIEIYNVVCIRTTDNRAGC